MGAPEAVPQQLHCHPPTVSPAGRAVTHAALTGFWLGQAVETAVGRVGDVNTKWGHRDRSDMVVMVSWSCVKRVVYTRVTPGVLSLGSHTCHWGRVRRAQETGWAWLTQPGLNILICVVKIMEIDQNKSEKCRNVTKNIKTGCPRDPHSVICVLVQPGLCCPAPRCTALGACDTHTGWCHSGPGPSTSHPPPHPSAPCSSVARAVPPLRAQLAQ